MTHRREEDKMLVRLPVPRDEGEFSYSVGTTPHGRPFVSARIDLRKVERALPLEQVKAILAGPVVLWVEYGEGVYRCDGDLRDTLRALGYGVIPDWEIVRDAARRAREAAEALDVDGTVAALGELDSCAVGFADGVDQILAADTYRAASVDPWVVQVSWAESVSDRAPYVGAREKPEGALAYRWIRLRRAPGAC
jgi:hypothetical protein